MVVVVFNIFGDTMSRSTNGSGKSVKSPVKYWVSFKGSNGTYTFWNGTENVSVDKLELVLLDTRGCITGWHDATNSRIWSNVVEKVSEELTVKAKGVEIAKGVYADIKDAVKNAGGNFTTNIYALAKFAGDTYELCCFQVDKTGLQAWSEFATNNKRSALYDNVIVCSKGDQQKNGAVKYFKPKFELGSEVDPVVAKDASDVDSTVLQPYFSGTATEEKEESSDVSAPF